MSKHLPSSLLWKSSLCKTWPDANRHHCIAMHWVQYAIAMSLECCKKSVIANVTPSITTVHHVNEIRNHHLQKCLRHQAIRCWWWGGWWKWLILPAEKFSASLINWLTRFIRGSINNRGSTAPAYVCSFLIPPRSPGIGTWPTSTQEEFEEV